MPAFLTAYWARLKAAHHEGIAEGRRRANARAVQRGWVRAERTHGAGEVIRVPGGLVIRGDEWLSEGEEG